MTTTDTGASPAPPTDPDDGLLAARVREHYGRTAVALQEIQQGIAAVVSMLEAELAALPAPGGFRLVQVTEVLPGDYVRLSELDEFIVARVEPVPPAGPWGKGGRALHMVGGQVRHLPTLARVQVRRLGSNPEPRTADHDCPVPVAEVVLAGEDRAERLDAAYDAGRIGPEGSAA